MKPCKWSAPIPKYWHSNDDWLVLTDHCHKPGLLAWIYAVGTKLWPYNQCASAEIERYVFPVFKCPLLVSLCPLQPQLSVLGWQKWSSTWSSAVVAPPPQGSAGCFSAHHNWTEWLSFLSAPTSLAIIRRLKYCYRNTQTSLSGPNNHITIHWKSLWILTEALDPYLHDCIACLAD